MRDGENRDGENRGGNYRDDSNQGRDRSVTEERRRSRHREHADHEAVDLERLRYFTQPADGASHTRHRRRRNPATGPIPAQRSAERAMPQRIPPRPAPSAPRPPEPEPAAADVTARVPQAPAEPPVSAPAPARDDRWVTDDHAWDDDQWSGHHRTETHWDDAQYDDATGSAPVTAPAPAGGFADILDHETAPVDHDLSRHRPADHRADDEYRDLDHGDFDHGDLDHPDLDHPDLDHADTVAAAPPRRRRGTRKRRRLVLALVLVCLLALIGGVGYVGLRAFGVLDSRKDYTNAAGTGDVLVDIPDNSTLQDFGRILVDADVVGSVKAFTNAADGQVISGGIYQMRTEIPASTAVAMLTDGTSHRVGRVVVPAGRQLDTKKRADGVVTPGIFQMIATATGVTINGQRKGVTVEQLEQTAATATPEQLGVPDWARTEVNALTGDHRRIEGLIVPITWERIDPSHSALQILHDLITQSTRQLAQWGLPSNNRSGLEPYQTLVAASLVQGEVNLADDYPKVARVILNRLDEGQRLQFDSTANYAADVTDLNVHSDVLRGDTPWNTYVHKGLPPTPIGAVDEQALEAMESPAAGDWLYFVTIDSSGTTLFTADFNQHRRNIGRACANGFITCN